MTVLLVFVCPQQSRHNATSLYSLTTLLCMVLELSLCSSLGVFFLGVVDVKAAIQRPEAPVRRVRRENEENSVAT